MKQKLKMKKTLTAALIGMAACGVQAAHPGEFGVGLTLGDPTGVTAKYWLDETTAVDAAASWSFPDDRASIHSDYLIHKFSDMADKPGSRWAYHYGVGARLNFKEHENRHHDRDNETAIGLRVPLGLDFYPASAPIELFAEIAPVLDLIRDVDFDFEFGVGVRYYFK